MEVRLIIQACLNGSRAAGSHPRFPVRVAELADDAVACVRAGANELHIHVRDGSGQESLQAPDVDALVSAVRARLPGTLLGVSTGVWIEGDDDRRLAAISGWRLLPDYASVNLSEAGAPAVIELLHRRGVGVEAGLATPADAERLLRLGLDRLALRILVEIDEQDPDEARATATAILTTLRRAGSAKPILLHGQGATKWAFVAWAARDSYSIRVGFEDGLTLPDGSVALSNAALAAAAVRAVRAARGDGGRESG
jgi:uncharacterized protein (DUF849 family)